MTMPDVGIDVSGRVIILGDLQQELNAGGVPTPHGITIVAPPAPPPTSFPPPQYPPLADGARLFTYDDEGNPADLPPEAEPIVEAYTPETSRPA